MPRRRSSTASNRCPSGKCDSGRDRIHLNPVSLLLGDPIENPTISARGGQCRPAALSGGINPSIPQDDNLCYSYNIFCTASGDARDCHGRRRTRLVPGYHLPVARVQWRTGSSVGPRLPDLSSGHAGFAGRCFHGCGNPFDHVAIEHTRNDIFRVQLVR